jgi:uncharacterized membrane protein
MKEKILNYISQKLKINFILSISLFLITLILGFFKEGFLIISIISIFYIIFLLDLKDSKNESKNRQ